jgi:geranylgeranylglycerol-phosphate geranylgeranyltransferase
MKLRSLFYLLFGVFGIINTTGLKIMPKKTTRLNNALYENQSSNLNPFPKTVSKINGLVSLIRPKSILPTIFLCGAGGFIMNPNLLNLLHSKTFITSTACTLLILPSSMVINDVYDVKIDRINNPGRPLASGRVKIYEALLLYFFLILSAETLSLYFLPGMQQYIINFVIFLTTIYTPLLKRVPLFKNLSCAWIVSLTMFFSGLSSSQTQFAIDNNGFGILSIAMSLVFYGSLSNEILLDIRDYEGDKANKIYTLPVIFGKKFSLVCATIITNLNILSNSLSLMYLTDITLGLLLAVICSPILFNIFNLFTLKNNHYSENEISTVVNETNKPLFFMLLYLCIISLLGDSSNITFFI